MLKAAHHFLDDINLVYDLSQMCDLRTDVLFDGLEPEERKLINFAAPPDMRQVIGLPLILLD